MPLPASTAADGCQPYARPRSLAAAPYVATAAGGGFAVITAINTLAEFAENLKKWFGYAKSDKEKKRLYRKGRKSPGQRSVEGIIKIAANTRSHVRVKYRSEKGEVLEADADTG